MGLKTRVIILLILIILSLAGVFYLYYKNTLDKRVMYEKSKNTYDLVLEEHKRCTQLLTQQSGNFTDYDYCRKFTQTFSLTK